MRRIINSRLRVAAYSKIGPATSLQCFKYSSEVEAIKNEKKDGPIKSLGLDDWKFALPAAMFVGIPSIHNEVFTVDAEFQVCACFVLFCSTCYTQLGPMISRSLNATTSEIRKEMTSLDNAIESQISSGIAQSSAALEMENAAKLMYATKDTIDAQLVENKNFAGVHLLKDAIVKKLDKLSALEDATDTNVRIRMLKAINTDVMSKVTSDKEVKDDTLAEAINVLSGDGKLGKDVIGKSFSDAVKKYKENYSKTPTGDDEIFLQLEKEMAAICSGIEVGRSGNIYDINTKQ